MGDAQNNGHRSVDPNFQKDPYQNFIADGHDRAFLQSLCEALDVGVSILNEDLDYQFISKSVFRDLGMDGSELSVGDNLTKCHDYMIKTGLLTSELLQENKLSAQDQQARKDVEGEPAPMIMQLGDGSTHKFIRKTLPNGYTVSMSNNITELVEKDHIIEKALELGNAGYWTYDFMTKEYFLSESLRHYFSKEDQTKIKKQGILAIVHPDDRDKFRVALKSLSKTNDKFRATCRSNTLNGNERWSTTTGQVIRDKAGKPVRIRAFVKDITRQRRQAKELERAKDEAIAASHAKSEFLANMSHEIRTPMNGVLGMAELLANSDINDRQREFVNVINNSASALLTIINDILDFSKIEAGAFEIDPMSFDLKSSVNDVTAMMSSAAQEKNIELIINYPINAHAQFIGDGGRLRQVITNLVGNAIKFTETGHIIIDVKISEPRNNVAFVTLSVTDTGIGIEEEKLEQVFNKFTQADSSTTRVYGGTGLGLSISKAIVELMDGRMTARSELGKGSTFTVRLPLEIDRNAVTKTFDTTILRHKTALIIDDIKVNRSLLKEQLTSWDIHSESVKDAVEALGRLKERAAAGQPYDFVLLDFLMPGMNGHELATLITSTPSLAGTPIIMLSSCDQPISSQEMQTKGIDRYLVKPVRETRLYNAIIDTLNNSPDNRTVSPNSAQQEMPTATLLGEAIRRIANDESVSKLFD